MTGVPGPCRADCAGVRAGPHFEKRCPRNPLIFPCHHPSRRSRSHSAVRRAVRLSQMRACARGMLAARSGRGASRLLCQGPWFSVTKWRLPRRSATARRHTHALPLLPPAVCPGWGRAGQGRAEWCPPGPALQEDLEQSLRGPCSLS